MISVHLPQKKLKMGLFENIPTILHDGVSTTFGTLSNFALDVGTSVISPQ